MDDDPLKISKAIKISRKCLRIVYQNIIFALWQLNLPVLDLALLELQICGLRSLPT